MKINKTKLLQESLFRLLSRHAHEHIQKLLHKSYAAEIAAAVRKLSDCDAVMVIKLIPDIVKEAETFVELEAQFVHTFLRETNDRDHVARVLQVLPKEKAASLLAGLQAADRDEILSFMQKSSKEGVSEVLLYGADTCGRIMSTNFFKVNQNTMARDAIDEIQSNSNLESIFYIYVVDDLAKLVGVVSLRQILQVRGDRLIKDFMTQDVIWVNIFDSQEKAASTVEEYNIVSLPVVDDDGKLVGIVMVDDVIDYIRVEAQEEAFKVAGVDPGVIEDFSFWRSLGAKGLWYGFLLLGGILCSEIILYYFSQFPQEIIFLCFAPLVLRLGGSIATQNITLLNQGILDLEIARSRAMKTMCGQNLIVISIAVLMSLVIFAYGFWRVPDNFSLVLGLSLGVVLVTLCSLVIGLIVPLIFYKLKFDSLKMSSRFVQFLMDAISLIIFFQSLRFIGGYGAKISRLWTP